MASVNDSPARNKRQLQHCSQKHEVERTLTKHLQFVTFLNFLTESEIHNM